VPEAKRKNTGGVRHYMDRRERRVAVPPARAFVPIRRIGGRQGWYYVHWLWRVRGWLDLLAGGVGLGRGRLDPDLLAVDEVLDWWRVEAYEPDAHLLLRAEMRVPGRAWLEFEVTPTPDGGSLIRQTARFEARGWAGVLYWYAMWPFHQFIFPGMLRRIARAAEV